MQEALQFPVKSSGAFEGVLLPHWRMQWPNTLEVSLSVFMTALPCPLPKHDDLPDGSSARPITILRQSQLYGTWAAVATSQIVKVLAHWVPPGVTGLLPSRRASDCAYSAQFELELAAKVRNRCSGIVMDPKKCFHNIRWICGLYFPQRKWSAH